MNVVIYNTISLLVSTLLQIPAEGVPINGELDVKVDFVAPELPGRYISYWMMASPIGVKFGQRVWVSINVLTRPLVLFLFLESLFIFVKMSLIPFLWLVAWSG